MSYEQKNLPDVPGAIHGQSARPGLFGHLPQTAAAAKREVTDE